MCWWLQIIAKDDCNDGSLSSQSWNPRRLSHCLGANAWQYRVEGCESEFESCKIGKEFLNQIDNNNIRYTVYILHIHTYLHTNIHTYILYIYVCIWTCANAQHSSFVGRVDAELAWILGMHRRKLLCNRILVIEARTRILGFLQLAFLQGDPWGIWSWWHGKTLWRRLFLHSKSQGQDLPAWYYSRHGSLDLVWLTYLVVVFGFFGGALISHDLPTW